MKIISEAQYNHVRKKSDGVEIAEGAIFGAMDKDRNIDADHDILSGKNTHYPGNEKLSHLVKENHKAYSNAENTIKFATGIVESLRSADPSSRFLTMNDADKYVDIVDAKAIKKVLEALRKYKKQ